MKDKIFGVLQRVGRSFMLPIALLPVAGLLLGIGSSFTNETMLAAYGLNSVIHPGTLIYTILDVMSQTGSAVFNNLALLFAMGVAIGMARKEKEVAALSGAVAYIIMNTAIQAMINAAGGVDAMPANSTTTMLGITTLQMGVFGGIVVGLGVAALHNKFYKIELPQVLAFFGGTRFVPIISSIVYLVVGIAMFYIWPVVQSGIAALGALVLASGYAGTFIYGLLERALIPFGLHHVFYMPFWQTAVGGTAIIDGVTVTGAQNIFFAELASPNTVKFSVDACRFLTGKYPFMMGGLPGAALAMYVCARPEKKKEAGSLLFSVALTAFLTGVTEPIEFTFLFLAPALFAVHVVLAGASFAICHILQICIGTTFSDGLIDFILYGVLPGQAKSNWMTLIPVIVVYFILYFFIFRFFIRKWNLKTPGREEDGEEVKMMTKDEYRKATGIGVAGGKAANIDPKAVNVLKGIGGSENVTEIDCCATRLRLTLVDSGKVNQPLLKATGASGVVIKGNAIQVIYGPSVTIVKSNLEELVEQIRAGAVSEAALMGEPEQPKEEAKPEPKKESSGTAKSWVLGAHLNGTVVPMDQVKDEVFASGALGDGVAIEPTEGKLYAPADCTVVNIFETKHAIGLSVDDDVELLLHIGIDTVKMGGKGFEAHVKEGQTVKKGELLVSFDMDAIKAAGYLCTTPMIVCNTDDYKEIKAVASGTVKASQDLLEIKN